MNIVSIYVPKGGNGKTSISFALTKEFEKSHYITNDKISSAIALHQLKEKASLINKTISVKPETEYLFFDAGGFIDDLTKKMIGKSNTLIIPIEYNNISLAILEKIIMDAKLLNLDAKLIIVVNKFNTNKDKKEDVLNSIYKKVGIIKNIVFIRHTNIFEAIQEQNLSIKEYINSRPMFKHTYKNFLEDWESLVKLI